MLPTPQPDRPDVQMAALVDLAIELLPARGPHAAATFLQASGASFGLIVRVLAEPDRRRELLPQNVLPLPRTTR